MIDSIESFFKSLNTPVESFLLSIALVISSVISNKAKYVDLVFFSENHTDYHFVLFHDIFQSVIKQLFKNFWELQ